MKREGGNSMSPTDDKRANQDRVGVLVMAHGTPSTPDGLEEFYTHIRHGRAPEPDQLRELRERYDAIGGISPLAERTSEQVDGLANLLHSDAPGKYLVRFGAKHVSPSIEDGARELCKAGVGRIIGLVLTPHSSSLGSNEYLSRAARAIEECLESDELSISSIFTPIEYWYDSVGFVDLMADLVLESLGSFPTVHHGIDRIPVIFSAHSLPVKSQSRSYEGTRSDHGSDDGFGDGPSDGPDNGPDQKEPIDDYQGQLGDSASLIAEAGEIDDWCIAWQSAGRTQDLWLEPSLDEVMTELSNDQNVKGVVVCPVGFVADHLEVLYDLDIEAKALADRLNLEFVRTPSLNSEPRFLRALADVVHDAERSPC